jgi:hypothetical protein
MCDAPLQGVLTTNKASLVQVSLLQVYLQQRTLLQDNSKLCWWVARPLTASLALEPSLFTKQKTLLAGLAVFPYGVGCTGVVLSWVLLEPTSTIKARLNRRR